VDGVAVCFTTVGEGDVGTEGLDAAECTFVAGGDVVVLVDGRLVDEEDEEVGVAVVAEAGGGLLAELLLDAGEPALGALPRGVRAVKLVGSVGAVAGGEEDVGCVVRGAGLPGGFPGEPGFRGEGVARVVSVWDEAVGGVAAAGELFGNGALGDGGAEVLFDGVVAASACAGDDGEAWGRRLGEEVDGSADGVGAVKRRSRPVEDVDSGDGVEGDGDVEV